MWPPLPEPGNLHGVDEAEVSRANGAGAAPRQPRPAPGGLLGLGRAGFTPAVTPEPLSRTGAPWQLQVPSALPLTELAHRFPHYRGLLEDVPPRI